jgi:hypothetical protein
MAIVIENSYSTSVASKSTTGTLTNVVVPTSANRAIYVFTSATQKSDNGSAYATGVTFNGTENFTLVGQIQFNKSVAEIWKLIAPTETTANVVVSWADDKGTSGGAAIGCYVLSNVDQITPDDGFNSNTGNGTSMTISIPTSANDLTIDVLSYKKSDTVTEAGDGTEQWNIPNSNVTGASSYFTAVDSQSDHGWTTTAAEDWTEAGVSINEQLILAYKDIPLKTSLESETIYKDLPLRTSVFSFTCKDVPLKTSVEAEDFNDIPLKTSVDVLNIKDLPLKASILSEDIYKDVSLKTDLESENIYGDIPLKVSLNVEQLKNIPLRSSIESEIKDRSIQLKATISILVCRDVQLASSIDIEKFKDVILRASISDDEIKYVPLKASIESETLYKDISLQTTIETIVYKGVQLKVSIFSLAIVDATPRVPPGNEWFIYSNVIFYARVFSLAGLNSDSCKWNFSLDNGKNWGTNPLCDDGIGCLAKVEDNPFKDGDENAVFGTSRDTTNGIDGTFYFVPLLEGYMNLIRWTVVDRNSNEFEEIFRVKVDTMAPGEVVIRAYKSSNKVTEVEDDGWTNDPTAFFEFTWVDEGSGIEAFSYTINGNEPDEVEEKEWTDPTYDMDSDPDPSN